MSDCHIWFGVVRSKNRGLGGFFFIRRGLVLGSSSCRCSVRRTVSGLAGRNRVRFSHWAIRRTPKPGCCVFTSTIFCFTSGGSFGLAALRDFPAGVSNPARPCFW